VIGFLILATVLLAPTLGAGYVLVSALLIAALGIMIFLSAQRSYRADDDKWGCFVGGFTLGLELGLAPAELTLPAAILIAVFGNLFVDGNSGMNCAMR
jgi:hypothetical protein